MFGAVQLGVLAACVVLFVPMGMAGWHLSRNKMLFFSCALFITLAVGVHLTPYFPSVSSFISSPASLSASSSPNVNRESCISLLHEITFSFRDENDDDCGNGSEFSSLRSCEAFWKWADSGHVVECEFQKLAKSDASDLLNGSWVVVAGDSQARLLVVSLLDLVSGKEKTKLSRGDLFKRHSDYSIMMDEIGMKLDFIWAPYMTNLTDMIMEFKERKQYPDVVVMGAGLWDMLHVTNASEYGLSLKLLRDLTTSLLPVSPEFESDDGPLTGLVSMRAPNLFWLGMPILINRMLNTEEKRQKMNDFEQEAYNEELYRSKTLCQSGGPLELLDIHALSDKCSAVCTSDGMHYDQVVYEAAVHIMLNALLIKSQQKLL